LKKSGPRGTTGFSYQEVRMDLNHQATSLGLDTTDYLELVEVFMETTDVDLLRLESGLSAGAFQEVAEAAHSIKGAAAGLGFENAQVLAKEIEMNARQNVLEGTREHAEAIKGELTAINEALKAFQSELSKGV
jgi:HPt (histidine-containing phosphotransfer) domain-containing protein